MDIKRILVPVDFSENSVQSKTFAEEIAERFGAEIELLHVVESSPYEVYVQKGFQADVPIYVPLGDSYPGASPNTIVRNLMDEARSELEKLATGNGRTYHTEVRRGRPVEEILAEIERYKPDLVVICTHGWSGVKHLLLGSVTEKLVRLSPVPVLTTRAHAGG